MWNASKTTHRSEEMKRYLLPLIALVALSSCKKEEGDHADAAAEVLVDAGEAADLAQGATAADAAEAATPADVTATGK